MSSAPNWVQPNWCNPCGSYRSRDHECERQQRPIAPAHQAIDWDAVNVPAGDPAYVMGWQAGYAAAVADLADRRMVVIGI